MADDQSNQSTTDQGKGMKIEVTPSAPVGQAQQPAFGEVKYGPETSHKKRLVYIGAAAAIVIALFAVIYFVILPNYSIQPTTTTTIITTTTTAQSGYLSSCGVISTPGSYYLQGSVKYSHTQGSCFNITSPSVSINCNGRGIIGSGPFSGTGPYSYGIVATHVSNVTIKNCMIANFSYGVYSQSAQSLTITGSNLTMNYVSSLYLDAVSGSTIQNNLFTNSSSPSGAVQITNGSTDNLFQNNTLKYNTFLGIYVNAVNNQFLDNYLVGSKYSFACFANSGFPKSNIASGNTCYNETGCDFLACNGINVPLNVSQITLTQTVDSCGSITSPGLYTIYGNINMDQYSNTMSGAISKYGIPCINIASPNVRLACNGFRIYNAYIGIKIGSTNDVVTNCNVNNSAIGVLFSNANVSTLSLASFAQNNVSVQMVNGFGDVLNNVNANNGTYGIYLKTTTSSIISNFSANLNKYGIYVNSSFGNIFQKGQALSNSRFDVFATPNAINVSSNLMSSTSCNVTDTLWSTCKQIVTNTTSLNFPIANCSTIGRSGTYVLTQNVVNARANCMTIKASNVTINCNGHLITANPFTNGAAFVALGFNGVNVTNCAATNFNEAAILNNSMFSRINRLNGTKIQNYGVELNNVFNSTINGTRIRGTQNASILLNNAKYMRITNNSGGMGTMPSVAISLFNATHNIIVNNTGFTNYVGIAFKGDSTNNTVYKNSYIESGFYDYYCSPLNTPLWAENGGVNTGVNDSNCDWLADIPPTANLLDCPLITTPTVVVLTHDYAYGTGTTCYTVQANVTTINCNGRTILATDGGVLLYAKNSRGGVILENCLLKGFSTPVIGVNASVSLINDTIYNNLTNGNRGTAVVNVSFSPDFQLKQTRIYTPYTGVYLYNDSNGNMQNSYVSAGTGFALYKSGTFQISNISTSGTTGLGLYMSNSTLDVISGSSLNGLTFGLQCIGSSKGSSGNTDAGQNFCSSNSGCSWISLSSSTCH